MKVIPAKTVLLVEDDEQDARSIRNILDEQDSQSFELTHMPSLTEAEICLASHSFDLVLLELDLPEPDLSVYDRDDHTPPSPTHEP